MHEASRTERLTKESSSIYKPYWFNTTDRRNVWQETLYWGYTEFLISQTRYIVDVVNRAEFLKCSYFLYVFLTLSRKIHGFTLSNNVASDVVKVQRFKHRLNDVWSKNIKQGWIGTARRACLPSAFQSYTEISTLYMMFSSLLNSMSQR